MFEWFKSKFNSYVPKDMEQSMMSSNFTSIKIGEKFVVPENVTCFVAYNDKLFATLVSGKHTISRELLIDLYDKQTRGDKKINSLKVDLFFVNSKPFDFSFTYIDKVPVQNKLTKLIFDIDFSANVCEEKKFYTFVTNELYSTNAEYTKRLVTNTVEEFLRKYFLKKKFASLNKPIAEIQDLDTKVVSFMQKIGVNIKNFKISITSKNNPIPQEKAKISIFEKSPSQKNSSQVNESDLVVPTISLDDYHIDDYTEKLKEEFEEKEIQEVEPTQTTQESSVEPQPIQPNDADNICPNCKVKLINGARFCHRCGYRKF